ncbi:hypothetical protein [Haloechinothrix sp. LS1_15]|uniref:hypothetical protein n=1 Tax=Haloechinothrix sp. LS1_15 TaxID=2652248 RepID=UPI002945C1D6|nr:hypothetical protein [Haloechinothrix sp. LS1_15]MDV6012326.1 hypothetical protein [Haloechinothrix sp. LS1_15]
MSGAEGDRPVGQPSIDEVLAKIDQSPLGPLLRDERAMDRMICDLMTESDDRVVREMGRELRDGNVSWRGLADVPAYREALESGLARMGELDLGEMSAQLDEAVEEQVESESKHESDETGDEPDELWRGFGRPLGGP